MLLPVEFIRARELATVEYDRLSPAAVVLLRQAGRRSAITPETTAKNEMNGKYPDNAGFWPEHIPVAEAAPVRCGLLCRWKILCARSATSGSRVKNQTTPVRSSVIRCSTRCFTTTKEVCRRGSSMSLT